MINRRPPLRAASRSTLRLAAVATAAAVVLAVPAQPAGAQQVVQSEEHPFRVVTVVEGLVNPWGMAFLPGGDILVTERPGRLRLVRGGKLQPQPVAGTPEVWANGQGGLLDVELHPRFAENRLVYLTYSKPAEGGATTALARGRWDGNRITGLADIFVAAAVGTRGQHFGSRIVFDSAGYVYVSVGERNEKTPAQELGNHKGTIVRLHDDGRVPRDNPFVGRQGARPEIFSYGHRNPQGMALHPVTRELWANEHGARGGDEINRVLAGRNYGWPAITHGVNYDGTPISPDTARAGMEQPVIHWTPSIAPSGMAFYTGDRFPRWKGNIFNGSMAGQQLRRVVLDGNRVTHQEVLLKDRARIRAVEVGPDGYIYLLTDAPRDAMMLRLEPGR
ncbi:MAG TPA: PQQ-dependent sugar dehydrogenase [Gemmatimonadaceae bacterium]|nr:PQQ-dependent sugar dehydrogenase [Gemmatimonadaceae bacterium]